MNIKTTLLATAAAVAMTAGVASAATMNLVYGTDVTGAILSDGSLDLTFVNPNELGGGNDFVIDAAFNLQDYTAIRIDPVISGSGSLTLTTFSSPFAPSGAGLAQVLLTVGTPLASGAAVSATWGSSAPVTITESGMSVALSTSFTEVGIGSSMEDLVFTWGGLENIQQLSANIAAVPVPAAGFLLMGALGGLGLARRRKDKKATA